MPRDDELELDPDAIDVNQWTIVPRRARDEVKPYHSTRVTRFRYDYGNKAIQVRWQNENKAYSNHGYVYQSFNEDATWREYKGMMDAVSRGKQINRMNPRMLYRPMTDEERYAGPTSRNKGPRDPRKRS
jgi:hypothetical protein